MKLRPILPIVLGAFGLASALLWPGTAAAWPTKFASCTSSQCHGTPDPDATMATAIDGVAGTSTTKTAGSSFEIDIHFTNATFPSDNDGTGVQFSLPSGWGIGSGTDNGPALAGWDTAWDQADGVGWATGTMYSTAGEFAGSPDGYTINFDGSGWDTGNRDAAFDTGGAGDLDGAADDMGTDATITVPFGTTPGAYAIEVFGLGHLDKKTKSYVRGTITVTVSVGVSTILGDGIDPSAAPTIAPGTAARQVDVFTLRASAGTDTVTALDVTLAPGTSAGVAQVEVTGIGGSPSYGTDTIPSGSTWALTGLSIPVTTTATNFEVWVTPKTHAAMPPVPGASYPVTATVGNLAAGNTVTGADTGSDTVTIDNLSPGEASWGTVTPGDAQVDLSWTNPGDADFAEVLILRRTTTISDIPTEGASYSAPGTLGSSQIVYVGAGTSFLDSGLSNGVGYTYKVFARDLRGNYSAVGAQTGPHTPLPPTTVLGNGTDPGGSPTVAPGAAAQLVDRFSLVTTAGGDTVTALEVTLSAGTSVGVAQVAITGSGGAPTYGTDLTAAGETWSFSLALPVTTSSASFEVWVTPKTHANMPAVPGASYSVTGTVGNLTAGNAVTGADTGSGTVIIDNLSPGDASWGSITPGDGQISLGWSNPGDADFLEVLILRRGNATLATPNEGQSYTAPGAIGSSTIVYAGSGSSFVDTGVTNGSNYYYKIFAHDSRGNYALGSLTGPHSPSAPAATTTLGNGTDPVANPTVAPGTAAQLVDRFSLMASAGTDTVTALDVTLAAGTSVGVAQVELTGSGGTPSYGTDLVPVTNTWGFTGLSIPVTSSVVEFEVWLTPKSHAAMPGVPGGTYVVTGTVGNLSAGNTVTGSDSGSGTVTIDNLSPGEASWGTVTPGDSQVSLSWSNPGDADFLEVVILRRTGTISDTPLEGASYSAPGTLGGSQIIYVGGGTSTTDTGLTNGQPYYYKVFARDSRGNYSAAGVQSGPHSPTSGVDTDAPCAATDLQVTATAIGSVTFTFVAPFENCAGSNGDPTTYMVRYDPGTITSGNWVQATVFDDAYLAVATAGSTETIVVSGLDSNTRYHFQVKAVDLATNVGPLATLLGAGSDEGQTRLHAGWNIVGVEGLLGPTNTCSGVFGAISCSTWVSTGVGDWSGGYLDTGAGGVVETGKGYWLDAGGGEDLAPPGDGSPTAGLVELPLQKGMNLLSNPHDRAIDVANLVIVQNGSTTRSYAQAVSAGWILPAVYAYDGANYFPEVHNSLPAGKIHPRKGYWLKLAIDDLNTYTVRIPDPTP